jgi:hypothetical protein
MKNYMIIITLAMLFTSPCRIIARSMSEHATQRETADPCISTDRSQSDANPFRCYDFSRSRVSTLSYRGLSRLIQKLLRQRRDSSLYYLELAELMKSAGDSRAELYYRKAIDSNRGESALHLFYADYLRNYRGPLKPLFPRAEHEYFDALHALRPSDSSETKDWDSETARRVERGLIALYQEEGLPLGVHNNISDWVMHAERPILFISTVNRWAGMTGDFDNVDDIRAFTSEALLASQRRLEQGFAPLTQSDFRSIARVSPQYETLERLRFRYKSLPALELNYRKRGIENGAITSFNAPGQTNDIRINSEYGLALEKPFSLPSGFDFFVRGRYARVERTGLIESAPAAREIINQYEATFAASRFIGPDKAILQANYLFQDINPKVPPGEVTKRDRQIASVKITYNLLRRFTGQSTDDAGLRKSSLKMDRNHFELRGWNFFGGAAHDDERFGSVILRKNDYFSGSEVKGIFTGKLDLGYQATIFTSEVAGNTLPSSLLMNRVAAGLPESDTLPQLLLKRANIQFRHNATVLFRIKDEEREPAIPLDVGWLHPALIHIVIPFKYDRALDRHQQFENFRIGGELDIKLYTAPFRGTTYLASVGYDREIFFNLRKSVNLVKANFSVGF